MIRRRDSRVDCGSHLASAFGPGFCAALTLRPLAMSASVHRQSVRPPPIGSTFDARINSRASHRLSVRNETPIFAAAAFVLYVFCIVVSSPALQRHKLDFHASEAIAHVVAAF